MRKTMEGKTQIKYERMNFTDQSTPVVGIPSPVLADN
jgi:hypothetical protein